MDADPSLAALIAARRSLRTSLARSAALSSSLSLLTPRLADIHLRLPYLAAALAAPAALAAVPAHIDSALAPAAAVLRVFDAVHSLEPPLLSDPRHDLPAYLAVLTRLQEALKFLSDNLALAITWLEDIVEFVHDNSLADRQFIQSLNSSLTALKSSPSPLDGGILNTALNNLEGEFRRLLADNSTPLPMSDTHFNSIAAAPLPVTVIRGLTSILDRMVANNRLDACLSIYIEVRGTNVRASLNALGLNYLEITPVEEASIQKWGRHMEFAVKHLFEAESKLCSEVFERTGPVWEGCFAEIAAQAGMMGFLGFGVAVTESNKDPVKLLRLLDIFATLSKVRLDFNRLFGGKACVEIQNRTRDLIKRVIEGASEIFWELLHQVELQRQSPAPSDGGVPRLVSFITDYCNKLLSEDYRPVLTQVLIIHRSWKKEQFQERLLTDAILSIIKALEANVEAWSKSYEDTVLSYLLTMNTHYHFFKHLKGTKLGELLGDAWLREHEQYKEYYLAMFLRESWGKLPELLSRDGLVLFSGGRATARDFVKKRLKSFSEAVDEMYEKQLNWVISDKDLKERMCQLIVHTIVPVYRSYMQSYGPLVEKDVSASKSVRYTAQSLEMMLGSVFLRKPGRSVSLRPRHLNGKVHMWSSASITPLQQ